MDGVLHCTNCRKQVKRHQTAKSKKKGVSEEYDSAGAYEKWDPKHPDFAKNYIIFAKNYKKHNGTNPPGGMRDFIAHMKKGVSEGKRADRYHIVKKDGKPANLASYADRASAVKDRDEKYPGATVQQVGPRGKVKGVAEAFIPPIPDAENWDASERQHREWKNRVIDYEREGYIGKVDLEVNNKAEAQRLTKRINALGRSEEENIHCTFANNVLTVRSKTMNSDDLDYFVDTAIEEPYSPN
jgi:hypothetical protein